MATHSIDEKCKAFGRFLNVLETLREKCPWDREQTNESLRTNTIEEVYELCDALLKSDDKEIQKELGDVLMHVCFYALMGEEKGSFDIVDVCNSLVDKLVFRHPHVYHPSQVGAANPKPLPFAAEPTSSETGATTSGEVLQNWEQLKLKEKNGNKTVLSGVPTALPSLVKAYRMQQKAANAGFDWERPGDVWGKVREELDELETELQADNKEQAARELGDYIFSLVNAARLYGINPDDALEQTNTKFRRRFGYVEEILKEQGRTLKEATLAEMDALWDEAKRKEGSSGMQ